MKKFIMIILVILLVLLYFNIDSRATRIKKTIEDHFFLTSKDSLFLKNTTGNIHIFSWVKKEVRMVAVKSVSKWGISYPENFLDKIKIETSKNKNSIRINTRYPLFSWHKNARVDYRLWVPETASIYLESLYGNIHIKASLSSISVKTDSGDVFLYFSEGISCNLDMMTVSGEICSEFNSVIGNVGSRKIEWKIGQGEGNIEIKTISGNISLLKL